MRHSLSERRPCPQCGEGGLHWSDRWVQGERADCYGCDRCGWVLAKERWVLPLEALREGRCAHCSGLRRGARCERCGLDQDEVAGFHEDLLRMVHPELAALPAAQHAGRQGRRRLALKLASFEALHGARPAPARRLRILLLAELGEPKRAAADARQWCADRPDDPWGWLALAEQLLTRAERTEAQAALERSLALGGEPELTLLQAAALQRAGEEAQTWRLLLGLLQGDTPREYKLAAMDQLTEQLVEAWEAGETQRALAGLDALGERADRHATALALRARLRWEQGEREEALALRGPALRLSKGEPGVSELLAPLGAAQASWLRWLRPRWRGGGSGDGID